MDVIYRLREGRRSEERVLSNYIEILKFLYDPDDLEIILGIVRDEKRHVLMVEGLIKTLEKKIGD